MWEEGTRAIARKIQGAFQGKPGICSYYNNVEEE
jgi:hypothetical protein